MRSSPDPREFSDDGACAMTGPERVSERARQAPALNGARPGVPFDRNDAPEQPFGTKWRIRRLRGIAPYDHFNQPSARQPERDDAMCGRAAAMAKEHDVAGAKRRTAERRDGDQ